MTAAQTESERDRIMEVIEELTRRTTAGQIVSLIVIAETADGDSLTVSRGRPAHSSTILNVERVVYDLKVTFFDVNLESGWGSTLKPVEDPKP